MNPLLSRRHFVATLPASIGAFALFARTSLAAGPAAAKPRVGCQANGFPLKPNDFPALLAALKRMKALGYAGFECNIRFVESEFGRIAEARKRIEDTGVEFIGTHMNMQQAKGDGFARQVENVAALGAVCIVMSGPGLAADGNFRPDALREKAATLQSIGQVCRRGGVRLAYHNHNPEFARQNAEMDGLAARTDAENLSFLMDAGHGKLGGGDPAAFMRKHPNRILGIHLKTYAGNQQVPLGKGDWGFEDLAAAIKDVRWAGWLITEEGGGPRGGNTAALGPDRDYIRNVFGV